MHDHYFCRWRELLSQLSDFHKCCCTVTQLSLKSHTPATSKIHTHSAKASSPGLLPQNKLKVRQPAHLQPSLPSSPCCEKQNHLLLEKKPVLELHRTQENSAGIPHRATKGLQALRRLGASRAVLLPNTPRRVKNHCEQ